MEQTDLKSGRRSFLIQTGTILGIGIAGTVVPGLLSSCQRNESPVISTVQKEIDVTQYAGLQTDYEGEKILFKGLNENMPILVIRKSEGNYIVFNTKCTHQNCEIDLPDSGSKTILCGCHGSFFNEEDGAVLNGPATTNLQILQSSFNAATNILTVTI
ncbi:MAG: Rieske 2Fe-2S domain-containing protein [Ignavibacteriae bacterium]|nr:Rieske 2Fe-2S domain-containing protein [Ignavibacteriota bacterium]